MKNAKLKNCSAEKRLNGICFSEIGNEKGNANMEIFLVMMGKMIKLKTPNFFLIIFIPICVLIFHTFP